MLGMLARGAGLLKPGAEKNVKWSQALGTKAYGGPIISGGKIFVGTNNWQPRDSAGCRQNCCSRTWNVNRSLSRAPETHPIGIEVCRRRSGGVTIC